MFNDVIISVDGPINGYVVVFDMEGVCLRHLTRVQFGPLRNFMAYIQVSRRALIKQISILMFEHFRKLILWDSKKFTSFTARGLSIKPWP